MPPNSKKRRLCVCLVLYDESNNHCWEIINGSKIEAALSLSVFILHGLRTDVRVHT